MSAEPTCRVGLGQLSWAIRREAALCTKSVLLRKKAQVLLRHGWNIHEVMMAIFFPFHYAVVAVRTQAVLALDVQRGVQATKLCHGKLQNMPSALCVRYLRGQRSCAVRAFFV